MSCWITTYYYPFTLPIFHSTQVWKRPSFFFIANVPRTLYSLYVYRLQARVTAVDRDIR